MKKTVCIMTFAALVAGVAGAADVSVSADFASAYVFRGVTLNDGLVMQPGAEISGFPIPEEYGSLAVGTWANYDLEDPDGGAGPLEKHEFSEIDYYISYSLPVSVADLGVTYTEYTYPQGGTSDKEIAVSLGKEIGTNGLYASVTANYGLDGAPEKSWYIQGALDYGMDLSDGLSLSAGVTAAYAVQEADEDGFNDATASVGASYALTDNWALNGSVTYIAQLDDAVLTDTEYDTDVVGMIGLSCDF